MPEFFELTEESQLIQDDSHCVYCHTDLLVFGKVATCHECKAPHHAECWQVNNNQCAAFGCMGYGAEAAQQVAQQVPHHTALTAVEESKGKLKNNSSENPITRQAKSWSYFLTFTKQLWRYKIFRYLVVATSIIILLLFVLWLNNHEQVTAQWLNNREQVMRRYHSFFIDSPSAPEPAKEINGITFVHLPASEFIMGSYIDGGGAGPPHRVYVDEFWMMQTEVTKAQYRLCMENGPCTKATDKRIADTAFDNHPVVGVDWFRANTFAEWIGGRLPTEAEWEYACRGTDGRVYSWGNEEPSPRRLNYMRSEGSDTTEVRSYPVGANGLYDMAGNVWEWTSSQYEDYPYQAEDGREEQDVDRLRMFMLRGGSLNVNTLSVRCTDRSGATPNHVRDNGGFRVVRHETARKN